MDIGLVKGAMSLWVPYRRYCEAQDLYTGNHICRKTPHSEPSYIYFVATQNLPAEQVGADYEGTGKN